MKKVEINQVKRKEKNSKTLKKVYRTIWNTKIDRKIIEVVKRRRLEQ